MSHIIPCTPLLDETFDGVAGLSFKQVLSRYALVLEPTSNILPGIQEFLFLDLSDDLGRTRDVLLLNHFLALDVIRLQLLCRTLCHLDHL